MALDTESDGADMDNVGSDGDVAIISRDDASNYNSDNILPEPPAVVNRIRQWLDPTPYSHEGGEYRRHLASHASGTGRWLTATENYRKWHDGRDHGLLWIRGIPGSGKSVFAATLVDSLAKEGYPVLFFFFRQIIDANHEPVHMLRDWLDQIIEYSPPLQRDLKAYIDEERKDLNRKLESLSIYDLWQHLKTALTHMHRVYVVADALDEMDKGNDGCLKSLARLGLWKPGGVKVLITSRPVSTVEVPLREFPALHIRLEEHLVDTDIATYVQQSLASSRVSVEDRALVKDAVPGRANGLFLYARLAMNAFLEPGADVRQVLEALPTDLNAMYTNLLREHARRSGVPADVQWLLLCWVTHAIRPLRLIEMAEMLRVTYNHDASGCHHDMKSAKALVRAACGPLLEIRPDETVSVVHHSLTEFLLGWTRSAGVGNNDSVSFPVLMLGPTHDQLSLSCIKYLQSSGCLDVTSRIGETEEEDARNWDEPGPESHAALRLQFPFAAYASSNWAVHAARSFSAGFASAALLPALVDFLTTGQRLDVWSRIEWQPRTAKNITAWHVAARYGLTQYLQHIISREGGANVDCVDSKGQSPLFYAAENGHADAVKLLIDAGAAPDADNNVGLKPLHRAASNNHAGVVTVLLAAGVSPMTQKTRENPSRRSGSASTSVGHTPLMYACRAGHMAAVEAFLPYLENVGMVQRALDWASRGGRSKVVKRLLQHPGVNVNLKVRGDTALFNACMQNDVESMEALLTAGADATRICRGVGPEWGPRTVSGSSMSPLEAFCSRRYGRAHLELEFSQLEHGLNLLLRAGANLHRRDLNLNTPLHHAAGRPDLLRLLLRAGADPNAESKDGGTLLHVKPRGEKGWELLKLLAEEGKGDINKRRQSDGKTPLLAFLKRPSDLDVCLRFINEFSPDCTVADDQGNTPLHVAASFRRANLQAEVIDALLTAGALISSRNRKGEMAVHVAKDMSVIELLVNRGADLEAQDNNGATPLMRELRERRHRWRRNMANLVGIGARTDTRDFRGRTLLHEAVSCLSLHEQDAGKNIEDLQYLLGLGLDIKQVDYAGNTVLHELTLRGYGPDMRASLFEYIVRCGADPDALNHSGQNVLHLLSAAGCDRTLLDVAIARCTKTNIDAPDLEGRRPIHLAASVSEGTVARLMAAGADISARTHNGLNALHVAASAWKSNVLGVLLAEITTSPLYRHVAGAIINATDDKGCTPLYCACLSGRAESVALLLNAGAEVECWTEKLFEACSQFELEERRERQLLADRTNGQIPRRFPDLGLASFAYFSNRLDEILSMLLDHGLDHSRGPRPCDTYLEIAICAFAGSDLDYTARCFLDLKARILSGAGQTSPLSAYCSAFTYRWGEIRREAAARAIYEVNPVSTAKGDRWLQERLFLELLSRREFDLVEAVFHEGGCDPCLPSESGWTVLHALVALGNASLLAKVATQDQVKQLDDVEWRREQESTGERNHPARGSVLPLVLAACNRDDPNMDVLRLLVEKLSASIDASHLRHEWQDGTGSSTYTLGDSPLHALAQGKRWWQVHQALPYLLLRQPDLEARNHNGETPLHKALDSTQQILGPFRKHAAKLLVTAGADVNAVTTLGKTPLAAASEDVELVRMLIAHGAKVTAEVVFSAIREQQVGVLEALLFADSERDPNLLRAATRKERQLRPAGETLDHAEHDEEHALYFAATRLRQSSQHDEPRELRKRCADMVRLLLAHGADPFDRFWAWKHASSRAATVATTASRRGAKDNGLSEYELCTVVHQVLRNNGVSGPFLELSDLDLERRNSSGETLLLAACSNPNTFCSTVKFAETEPLLISVLLERGADTSARDNQDRNALHLVFGSVLAWRGSVGGNMTNFQEPLRSLLTCHPILVKQADHSGKTALHYALAALKESFQGQGVGEQIINLLLSAGSDPASVDRSTGDGALHFLVRALNQNRACPALFRQFLALGLDINARNAKGETPLFGLLEGMYCSKHGGGSEPPPEDDAWRLLQDAGAGFRAKDNEGRSMLHLAAEKPYCEVGCILAFQRLVAMGLDPMDLDERQRTSLDVAAACRNEAVLELFKG